MKITYIPALAALAFCCAGLAMTRDASAAAEKACQEAVNASTVEWASKFVPGTPPAQKAGDVKPPASQPAPSDQKEAPADPKPSQSPRIRAVSLESVVEVKVTKLDELYKACSTSRIVLFLNGYPIKSLTPSPPTGPSTGRLLFKMSVSDSSRQSSDSADAAKKANDARQSWTPVLGQPSFSPRTVAVSIGPEDGYSAPANMEMTTLDLDIIPTQFFVIWGIIFLIMLGIFLSFALGTNIIRDGNPNPESASANAKSSSVPRAQYGPYSLSKTQGAWWFFIILAAYLFIGIITGDFTSSLNSTALILLGIGAGTVVAAALIDKAQEAKDTPKVQSASDTAADNLSRLDADIKAKQAQIDAAPADKVDALKLELALLNAEKEKKQSEYRKLTRQNEQFLTDILSDANGISFHRFQMAAWTLVLGIIFISSVFYNLAMPVFDTTLMGLLGLSAGTYLGLKIPEAATPKA
jgi:hypothetical protein